MRFIIPFLLVSVFCWGQTQLGQDIDGAEEFDQSGWSVSLSRNGERVAVGAPGNDANGNNNAGHTRVFEFLDSDWSQIGQNLGGDEEFDNSGSSVALSANGQVLAVAYIENTGSTSTTGDGYVRIFRWVDDTWSQIGDDIEGEAQGDLSGVGLSLSAMGNVVAIGASENGGTGERSGHVRVYENVNDVWTQVGSDIDGEAEGDGFGRSVSLSANGTVLAVGAPNNDDAGFRVGHARVFENINGIWTQIGADIDGVGINELSGFSIALSGNGRLVAVGAPFNSDIGSSFGVVRVYENINDVWTQLGDDIEGSAVNDQLGYSLDISTNREILAIGARQFGLGNGYVRIFQRIDGDLVEVGSNIEGEAVFDNFGSSVALSESGRFLAVGAVDNDNSGGDRAGHARVYDLDAILSVEEVTASIQPTLVPNPADAYFEIHSRENIQIRSIQITTSTGRSLGEFKNVYPQINTTQWASGVYFVRIDSDQGSWIEKLMVR